MHLWLNDSYVPDRKFLASLQFDGTDIIYAATANQHIISVTDYVKIMRNELS